MYNWSTDEKQLKKDKYIIWKLEQMVNFGLGGKKLKADLLKKHWKQINIDPYRREYLESILYEKRNIK